MTISKKRRGPGPSQQASILANIFEGAQAAILPWETFRLHSATGEHWDTWKEHSSQALAIDVFGTIKFAAECEAVLDRIASEVGLPVGGPWNVHLEWKDPDNWLGEKQPTWVDAVAESPHALMFFECKFTETDGGVCSQTQPLKSGARRGLRQCNGSYMWQTNRVNGREARCILTTKGIHYWDVIPKVFDYDTNESYFECPFRGPWFQWMRNLTVCYQAARNTGRQPAVLVVYADAPGLPMAERVKSPEWTRLLGRLQSRAVTFRAIPFQQMTHLAREAAPHDHLWVQLEEWVNTKIESVSRKRLRM